MLVTAPFYYLSIVVTPIKKCQCKENFNIIFEYNIYPYKPKIPISPFRKILSKQNPTWYKKPT